MASYSFNELAAFCEGKVFGKKPEQKLHRIYFDSRSITKSQNAFFIAIETESSDGHKYAKQAYEKGIRHFMIHHKSIKEDLLELKDVTILYSRNTLRSIQEIAQAHREKFKMPVIGITGSNGKTIVKEWLFQALHAEKNTLRSPSSYNSQLGVALSIWPLNEQTELGIFEAGISKPNEMARLEPMIQAGTGIFTNIGPAHQANFKSYHEKIIEKLQLFKNSKTLIYRKDHKQLNDAIEEAREKLFFTNDINLFTWGTAVDAKVTIFKNDVTEGSRELRLRYEGRELNLSLPFSDEISFENAMHLTTCLLLEGYSERFINEKLQGLEGVEMRLTRKKGTNENLLINDFYNSDIRSLEFALNRLKAENKAEKILVLSDFIQSGIETDELQKELKAILKDSKITELHLIGPEFYEQRENFDKPNTHFYSDTPAFIRSGNHLKWKNAAILLKGARSFAFENIADELEAKTHQTMLSINLSNISHNLRYYRSLLNRRTKLMAMVKASAYGAGSYEVAKLLQEQRVDYLGVAYIDEGISLRANGIQLPIMVINPESRKLKKLVEYELEPEIYSLEQFKEFISESKSLALDLPPVHLMFDTGMHRLGLEEEDVSSLRALLQENPQIKVASVFSHLLASDMQEGDLVSQNQAKLFRKIRSQLTDVLPENTLCHLANSAAISRFPDLQFNMVRLGLGLYGIGHSAEIQAKLQLAGKFSTHVSQVKQIKKGEYIGYALKGKAEKDMRIATIAVGYADGFPRSLGNGNFSVRINQQIHKTIGNVCMDLCMINIEDADIKEGDEVILFETPGDLERWSIAQKTIPYEVLSQISERVRRVYFSE